MKIKSFELISNPDRIRAGEEIVVCVKVHYEDGTTRCGIGTTKKQDQKSLNQAMMSAVEAASENKSIYLDLALEASALGGRKLISSSDESKLEEYESICTLTQQEEIDEVCAQLGIASIKVENEYNLATYYCLFASLNKLLDR